MKQVTLLKTCTITSRQLSNDNNKLQLTNFNPIDIIKSKNGKTTADIQRLIELSFEPEVYPDGLKNH
jgi:hypothetical protein